MQYRKEATQKGIWILKVLYVMSVAIPHWKEGQGSDFFSCFLHNCRVLAVALHDLGIFTKPFFGLFFHGVLNSGTGIFTEGAVGYTAICTGLGREQGSFIINPFVQTNSDQKALSLRSMPESPGKENGRIYAGLGQWTHSFGVLRSIRICPAPAPLWKFSWNLLLWKITAEQSYQKSPGYNTSKSIQQQSKKNITSSSSISELVIASKCH